MVIRTDGIIEARYEREQQALSDTREIVRIVDPPRLRAFDVNDRDVVKLHRVHRGSPPLDGVDRIVCRRLLKPSVVGEFSFPESCSGGLCRLLYWVCRNLSDISHMSARRIAILSVNREGNSPRRLAFLHPRGLSENKSHLKRAEKAKEALRIISVRLNIVQRLRDISRRRRVAFGRVARVGQL